MKRNIGTALLFVLLLLTVVAINKVDTPRDSVTNSIDATVTTK